VGAGYRHVSHPALDVSHVVRADAWARLGRVELAALLEVEADGGYNQAQATVAVWLPWAALGSREWRLGGEFTRHGLPDDDLALAMGVVWLESIWRLGRAIPTWPGGFARVRLAIGGEVVDYPSVDGTFDDVYARLPLELGVGMWIGRSGFELNYMHRKDGFPGGLYSGDTYAGVLGSVGLQGRFYLGARWALAGEDRLGTGYTAWAGTQWEF
jgi:hypothetical protein